MKHAVVVAVGLIAAAVLGLQGWRWLDARRDADAWSRLARPAPGPSATFDPAMVSDLPDPARRYFLFAIAPGTRLSQVAELEMTGQLSLGTQGRPDYMPMRARQILAGPRGFVWQLRAGSPRLWFSGSDGYVSGQGWTRFWLYDVAPVARAGGDADYARSAAGRAIAESLFWVPAALLPSASVRWEPVDNDTARAIVSQGGHDHVLDLTVASDGRPRAVSILRWSRENAQRVWRLQPFGGTIGEIRQVGGYRVAASVEGGNGFGTAAYFPFYRARITRIRFR